MQYGKLVEAIAELLKTNAGTFVRNEEAPRTERDRDLEVDATFRPIKLDVQGYKGDDAAFVVRMAQMQYPQNVPMSVGYVFSQIAKDNPSVVKHLSIEGANQVSFNGDKYLRALRDIFDTVKTQINVSPWRDLLVCLSSFDEIGPAVSIFAQHEGMMVLINVKPQ